CVWLWMCMYVHVSMHVYVCVFVIPWLLLLCGLGCSQPEWKRGKASRCVCVAVCVCVCVCVCLCVSQCVWRCFYRVAVWSPPCVWMWRLWVGGLVLAGGTHS